MVIIYSAKWCGPCKVAKNILDSKGINYKEIDIEDENISRQKLKEITGGYTVPQIIINNKIIGGYNELLKIEQSGKLEKIINDCWNSKKENN